MKRAALHLRRSTDEHQAASIAMQREHLMVFAEKNGWTVAPEHVFVDEGLSRAEFLKRRGLQVLLAAAEAGEFDIILCYDESRLGGDAFRTASMIADLIEQGIRIFYSARGGHEVTLHDVKDKLLLFFDGIKSESEREDISRRTRDHLKRRASMGLNAGGALAAGSWRRGAAPRFMRAGLAKCAICGGAIHGNNGRKGNELIKVYLCGRHRDRGAAVCGNTVRRPVDVVDAAVLGDIQRVVLNEEFIVQVLDEFRRQTAEQAEAAVRDAPELEKRLHALRAEIERLTNALATTDDKPDAVLRAIGARESEAKEIESRLAALRTAPGVFHVETRKLEQEARKRAAELRLLLQRHPEEARQTLEALLDAPLSFTPIEVEGAKRYRIEGSVSLDSLFRTASVPNGIRTVMNRGATRRSPLDDEVANIRIPLHFVVGARWR